MSEIIDPATGEVYLDEEYIEEVLNEQDQVEIQEFDSLYVINFEGNLKEFVRQQQTSKKVKKRSIFS